MGSLIHRQMLLTHWDRVTHIHVGKLTIIGSDNGLSPGWRQATIRTNAGILLIGQLRTNLREISIEIQTFSLKKIHLKMSSVKCCPFRLGPNVLILKQSVDPQCRLKRIPFHGCVQSSFFTGVSSLQIHFSASWTSMPWWRHQMEIFAALLARCAGNPPVTGEFPSQRPVTRSFDFFSLICAWIKGWVNNR